MSEERKCSTRFKLVKMASTIKVKKYYAIISSRSFDNANEWFVFVILSPLCLAIDETGKATRFKNVVRML